jgi:hypothetical protein
MKPGLKLHEGRPAGRDPREMTQDELREAGHEPMSPLRAVRARCLDCCGYQEKEVALCPARDCPAWPFRMGTDPWRKPASEARRVAARRVMTRLNARRNRGGIAPSDTPPDHGIEPSPATGPGVASVWTTTRVNRDPAPVRDRADGNGSGEDGDQFGDEPISDDDQAITANGEAPEGRAA